jgi:hypothetical protein
VRRRLALVLAGIALAVAPASGAQADVKDDCYDITFRAATVCNKIPDGLPVLSDGS